MQRGRQNLASGPRPAEIGGDQRFYGKFGRLRDAGGDALRCRCAIGPAHQPSVWLNRAVAKQMKQKRFRHAFGQPDWAQSPMLLWRRPEETRVGDGGWRT